MEKTTARRAAWPIIPAVLVLVLGWLAWPGPVLVDLATIAEGPMEVAVEDDGKTQVRHIYTVSAPVAGKVLRISHPADFPSISRHVGDLVTASETIVAVMQPMLPGFNDIRSRQQLRADVAAADAAVTQAEADVHRLRAAVEFSRTEFQRAQTLVRGQTISVQAYDRAKFDVETNEAALASATAQVGVRRALRESLAARLIDPSNATEPSGQSCCIEIRSPVTGRVLKIVQESETVVQAGSPLIEIGDPADLEIVADLLSTDAVRIAEGAPVRIENWGGPPLAGRVRRVAPAGFLKVSALGIEEQRVQVTIDFTSPPAAWSSLGHHYRVVVRVTAWKSDRVRIVPVAALFRRENDWAVYTVRDGRARATIVRIDHRNSRGAEVVAGLSLGDQVVLHPSDRINDGTRVAERGTR